MISPRLGFGAELVNKVGMGGIPGYLTGLGGLGGTVNQSMTGPPYCSDFPTYDSLLAYFGVENCTTYDAKMDVAGSYACVQRNNDKLVAVSNFQQHCPIDPNAYNPQLPYGDNVNPVPVGQTQNNNGNGGGLVYFGNNTSVQGNPAVGQPITAAWYGTNNPLFASQYPNLVNPVAQSDPNAPSNYNPNTTNTTNTGIPVSQSSSVKGGSLYFYNTTSGNNQSFKVGDKFQINITGASPNQPVSVRGTQNGVTNINTIGVTDGSGSYVNIGVMDSSTVGNWNEVWMVGGVNTGGGNISFTVSNTTSNPGRTDNTGTLNPGGNMSPGGSPGGSISVPVSSGGGGNPYTNPPVTGTGTNNGNMPNNPTNPGNPVGGGSVPIGADTHPTNTTNNGVPTSPTGSGGSDFGVGFSYLFDPSMWGTVFASGDTSAMLGLGIPLALVGYVTLKAFKIIR